MEQRLAQVPANGIPPKPNWEILRDLRDRQRITYVQMKGESLPRDDRLDIIGDKHPLKGFMDFLDGRGTQPFKDLGDNEMAEGLQLSGAMHDLHEDAAYMQLHPRIRKALVMGDEVQSFCARLHTEKSRIVSDRNVARVTRFAERNRNTKALIANVKEKGLEFMRSACVPSRVRAAARKKIPAKPSSKVKVAIKKGLGKKKPSGSERRKMQAKFAEDLKKLREEMEAHNQLLQSKQESALCEKARVEDELRRAEPGKLPPIQQDQPPTNKTGPDCAKERQNLKNVATALTLHCCSLKKMQENVQKRQDELQHAEKLNKKSVAKIKQAASDHLLYVQRVLAVADSGKQPEPAGHGPPVVPPSSAPSHALSAPGPAAAEGLLIN